jgi:hypothetical protein
MRVNEEFFSRDSFTVGDGKRTRFWEEVWLGDMPLAQQYPSLYSIVQRKQVFLADVFNHSPLNIAFLRTFSENRWCLWLGNDAYSPK